LLNTTPAGTLFIVAFPSLSKLTFLGSLRSVMPALILEVNVNKLRNTKKKK